MTSYCFITLFENLQNGLAVLGHDSFILFYILVNQMYCLAKFTIFFMFFIEILCDFDGALLNICIFLDNVYNFIHHVAL